MKQFDWLHGNKFLIYIDGQLMLLTLCGQIIWLFVSFPVLSQSWESTFMREVIWPDNTSTTDNLQYIRCYLAYRSSTRLLCIAVKKWTDLSCRFCFQFSQHHHQILSSVIGCLFFCRNATQVLWLTSTLKFLCTQACSFVFFNKLPDIFYRSYNLLYWWFIRERFMPTLSVT